MALNYFNCTLGEAVKLREENPPPWKTIPELLLWQARHNTDQLALGLPIAPSTSGGEWGSQKFSFGGLIDVIRTYAVSLRSHVTPGEPVGLLCTSGREFLFSWLGLMYLGVPVLLIATEVPIAGISGLLEEVGAKILFHDKKYAKNAEQAVGNILKLDRNGFRTVQLQLTTEAYENPSQLQLPESIKESSIAYYHHTSGTSSGTPKAIPTTHFGAAGALPMLQDTGVTFTTTPLFHGGPADCFRAWTSGAAIWLFPGIGDVPIMPRNIIDAFNQAKPNNKEGRIPYFTAVPYIIEALAATQEGVQLLQSVDTVGTGGAALSAQVGHTLAGLHRVPLISRYGAAECGFMLSSRRNYATETDWQYLRVYENPYLQFIRQSPPLDNVFELKLKDWPFMAKPNPDNTYNTGDCFEQHSEKSNLFRYHSRADAQIALSTGLKFDPNFIEMQLFENLRNLGTIREIYVFGKGKTYPGLFVFRKESDLKDHELTDQVWGALEVLNGQLPSHAKIRRNMVVVLPMNAPALARSSKGTLLRGQVDEILKTEIIQAYQRPTGPTGERKPLDLQKLAFDVRATVREVAFPASVAAESIPTTQDLFSMGIDSQYAMAIREHLQTQYAQVLDVELPPMWVYECGSIDEMIKYLIGLYQGEGLAPDDAFERMVAMRQQFRHMWMPSGKSQREPLPLPSPRINGGNANYKECVILTGVTGTLGIHILDQLRSSDRIREIHCLIRGADQNAAQERVRKALLQKNLHPLEKSNAALHIHTCKLSEQDLGLSDETVSMLSQSATVIIHAAWQVNFNLPLKGFEDQLRSLQNLLSFALNSKRSAPPAFVFCSSTASVLGSGRPEPIREEIYDNPEVSSEIGYARSKWVAEGVCADVHQDYGLPITVVRIGQLCGDTATGTWNVTEAWPLMLSSSRVTGSLPRLEERLDWLKVDIAASAVIELAQDLLLRSQSQEGSQSSVPVYHVINSQKTPTWVDMLNWIKKYKPGLETLPPWEWVDNLERLQGDAKEHPARKLLGLWKNAYGKSKDDRPEPSHGSKEPLFELEKTLKAAPVLKDVEPLDEQWFAKVWDWVEREM